MNISQEGRAPYNRISARDMHLIGKTDDYVPLFTIYRPFPANIDVRSLPASPLKERLQVRIAEKGERPLMPVEKLLINRACDAVVDGFDYYRDFLKEFRQSTHVLVHDNDLEYQIKAGPGSGTSYADLFTSIKTRNYWQLTHLRSGKFVTNLWFAAEAEYETHSRAIGPGSEVKTLFCAMAKREMIPYLRMCYLMGEDPHPSSLELWVRDDLDVTRGAYKNLRPKYRKELKKTVEESGIKIVEMPSLDDVMYHKINVPKFKRLSERGVWYKERSEEFLQSLVATRRIRNNSSIELIA